MLKEQMKTAREDIIKVILTYLILARFYFFFSISKLLFDFKKVEKNTVESMKMLLDLDNMKTNMTIASNALQV